jgi:hypothetical protein
MLIKPDKSPEGKNKLKDKKTKADYLALKKQTDQDKLFKLQTDLLGTRMDFKRNLMVLNINGFISNAEFDTANIYLERKSKYNKTLSGSTFRTKLETKLTNYSEAIANMCNQRVLLLAKPKPNIDQMRQSIRIISQERESIKSEKLSMPNITESLKIQGYFSKKTGEKAHARVIEEISDQYFLWDIPGAEGYSKEKTSEIKKQILHNISLFFNIQNKQGATLEAFIKKLPPLDKDYKVNIEKLVSNKLFQEKVTNPVLKSHKDYFKLFDVTRIASTTPTSGATPRATRNPQLRDLFAKYRISKPPGKPRAKPTAGAKSVAGAKPTVGAKSPGQPGTTPTVGANIPGQPGATPSTNLPAGGGQPSGTPTTPDAGSQGGGESPRTVPRSPRMYKYFSQERDKIQKLMQGTLTEAISVLRTYNYAGCKRRNYLIREQEYGDERAESIKAEVLRLFTLEKGKTNPNSYKLEKLDDIYSALNSPGHARIWDDYEEDDDGLPVIEPSGDASSFEGGYDEGEDFGFF